MICFIKLRTAQINTIIGLCCSFMKWSLRRWLPRNMKLKYDVVFERTALGISNQGQGYGRSLKYQKQILKSCISAFGKGGMLRLSITVHQIMIYKTFEYRHA